MDVVKSRRKMENICMLLKLAVHKSSTSSSCRMDVGQKNKNDDNNNAEEAFSNAKIKGKYGSGSASKILGPFLMFINLPKHYHANVLLSSANKNIQGIFFLIQIVSFQKRFIASWLHARISVLTR